MIGTCHLCGNLRKLVDSHILAKAFYHLEEAPKLLAGEPGVHARRAPQGEYDQIVCLECERLFGPWDEYAVRILDKGHIGNAVPTNVEGVSLIPNIEYAPLKLFFMSLLWRAGVSDRQFSERINLGPYESELRRHILANDPGSSEDFGVVLCRMTGLPRATAIFQPVERKFSLGHEYRNCYAFPFNALNAWIKVDRRPFPSPSPVSLMPGEHLAIYSTDFVGSFVHAGADRVIRNNMKAFGGRQ